MAKIFQNPMRKWGEQETKWIQSQIKIKPHPDILSLNSWKPITKYILKAARGEKKSYLIHKGKEKNCISCQILCKPDTVEEFL